MIVFTAPDEAAMRGRDVVFLYTPEAQEIIARNFYRPRDPQVALVIDGIEVQNFSDSKILTRVPFSITKNQAGREQVTYSREFIWLQMLNRGHRYAAMAVCDAWTSNRAR